MTLHATKFSLLGRNFNFGADNFDLKLPFILNGDRQLFRESVNLFLGRLKLIGDLTDLTLGVIHRASAGRALHETDARPTQKQGADQKADEQMTQR